MIVDPRRKDAHMSAVRKLILVDPNDRSRAELLEQIRSLGSIVVVETLKSYDGVPDAVRRIEFDILLIVLDSDLELGLEAARLVRSADPVAAILPACHNPDGPTILKALRVGAHEFLPLPSDPEEILGSIDRLLHEDTGSEGSSKLIAVTGASGGIGTSTVAVNLACTLAKAPGRSVALVDLDLILGTVDTMLDIVPDQTLVDVVTDAQRLDPTLLRRAMTRHESGAHILPGPSAMKDAARVEPEALRHVLELLKQSYSFVVVDTSKAFQATDFVAFDLAETIFLITQLDLCSLRNSARLIQLLKECEDMVSRAQVIVNRVGSDLNAISLKKAEETLGLKLKWQIPNASNLFGPARLKGVPIEVEGAGSRADRAFREIAQSFAPIHTPGGSKPKRKLARIATLFT